MGTSAEANPNCSFQSRLNRVAAQRAPFEDDMPEVSVLPDWKAHFRLPLAILSAFFIGILAVIAARTARLDFLGGTFIGENADTSMMIDAGMALFGGLTLCVLLRYRNAFCLAGNVVGVVVALLMAHNLVHVAPVVFSSAYDDAWTAEVATASDPGSIYFRGTFTTVLPSVEDVAAAEEESEAEEVVMPRVIRLQ